MISNGEKLNLFPRLEPLSPLLLEFLLEVLNKVIRQENEIKGIQMGKKKEVKLSLFANSMTVYIKNLLTIKMLLELK